MLKRQCWFLVLLVILSLLPTHATSSDDDDDDACGGDEWCSAVREQRRDWGLYGGQTLQFEVISERPRIYLFPNFLSYQEIDTIKRMGLPHTKPSRTDKGLAENIRSSKNFFFSPEQEMATPEIMALKHRAAAVSHVTLEFQEELQIQTYAPPRADGKKDFYIPHLDWIPSRPRVATLLIYLEEPEKGGETIFPLVRHNSSQRNGQLYDRKAAEQAAEKIWSQGACDASDEESPWLRFFPRKGAAVLFYNVRPDNSIDPLSIHGSCPVLAGTKTVLQQWLSTAWMAPTHSPDIQLFYRSLSFSPSVSLIPDGSGRGRQLRKAKSTGAIGGGGQIELRGSSGGGEIIRMCSDRGAAPDVGQSRQFTLALDVGLEFCASEVALAVELSAPKGNSSKRASWALQISNCQASLSVPGSKAPPITAQLQKNAWTHVAVVTEDISYKPTPTDDGSDKLWKFRSYLVTGGDVWSAAVEGKVKGGACGPGHPEFKYKKPPLQYDLYQESGVVYLIWGGVDWTRSRLCLSNGRPNNADFSQVYLLSKQLSREELIHIRKRAASDRAEPRVMPDSPGPGQLASAGGAGEGSVDGERAVP